MVLPDGYFPLIQNARIKDGIPVVRNGVTQVIASTGLPVGGTYLGAYITDDLKVIAIGDAGAGKLYMWTGAAWSEITATTGAAGNTRLSSASAPVHFAVVREPMVFDMQVFTDPADRYLVVQNLIDYPLIINTKTAYITAGDINKSAPLERPDSKVAAAQPVCGAYFNLQGSVSKTESDAAKMPATITLDSTGQWLQVDLKTTIVDGTNVTFQFPNVSLAVEPYQMFFVYSCADADIFKRLKVSLVTSVGAEYVVYDPDDPVTVPINTVIRGPSNTSYNHAALSLYGVDSGGTDIALPATNYNRVKLTWNGDPPPADIALKIYAIAFGGQIQYGARFAITYFCGGWDSASYREGGGPRTESPPTHCVIERTPTLQEIGGTPLPGVRLAEASGFRYRYRIRYPNPATLSATSPATHLLVYAQYTGSEAEYTLTNWNPPRIGKYTGGAWAYESGTAYTMRTLDVNAEAITRRRIPSEFMTAIPIGSTMLFNGARLFIGNAKIDTTTTGVGQIAITERDYPFRASFRVRNSNGYIDPDSGTYASIPNQTIKRIVEASASPIGADGVIVLSDQGYYSLDASSAAALSAPRWMSPVGTMAARSVGVWQGEVSWLDTELQVRSLKYDAASISKNVVENYLAAIPESQLDRVCGIVFKDCYHIAMSQELGGGQGTVGVFDYRLQAWTFDSKPFDIRDWFVIKSGNHFKLYAVHADLTIHEHESTSTTDNGTAITATIRSKTIAHPEVSSLVLGQAHLRTSALTSTITVTRTAAEDSAKTKSGTISTTASGTITMLWKSDRSGGVVPSLHADAISVTVQLSAVSGFKIFDANIEILEANGGPDA